MQWNGLHVFFLLHDFLDVAGDRQQSSLNQLVIGSYICQVESLHTVRELNVPEDVVCAKRHQVIDEEIVGCHQKVLNILSGDLHTSCVQILENGYSLSLRRNQGGQNQSLLVSADPRSI